MSQGTGGWVLILRCNGCDSTDTFRGVLLTLAGDLAVKAGWQVEADAAVLMGEPGSREELCSKCVDAMR